MTAPPRLTVITIGYNSIDDLRVTRRSVESQTYVNLHHLLIDGASTDGSADLVLSWAVEHDNVLAVSAPDSGIYDAMNRGIDQISEGYLLFLNAGDTFAGPDRLERAMAQIVAEPMPPDLAIGWARFVDSKGPMPYVVGGPTPTAITSAQESTIFSYRFHQNERYDDALKLGADYALFRALALRTDVTVLRLHFTISNFVFGGRSNDPAYDGARFLERARIDASFGEVPTAVTYLRIGARMVMRRLVYRLVGPDRAADFFLRLACRRGNSGARRLPVGQVEVEPRSPG